MRKRTKLTLVLVAAAGLSACNQNDNSPPARSSAQGVPPAKGAMDQSNTKEDTRITADVRRSILDDSSLSTASHNCTVVTDHGVVTLRGQVANEEEKASIASKAQAVAGVARVDNQLTVKP